MRYIFVLIALFCVSKVAAEDDDWLGSDTYGGYIGLRYGAYEDDGRNVSINTTLPFFSYSQLHAVYSDFSVDFDGEDQGSQQWAIYWNSDPLNTWSYGIGFDSNGEGSSVENQDIHVYLQKSLNDHWSIRGKYLSGEINLHVEGLPEEIETRFRSLGLLERKRNGYGLAVNYDNIFWGWRVSAHFYDYESDPVVTESESADFLQSISVQSEQEARYWLALLYLGVYQDYRELGFNDRQSRLLTNRDFSDNAEAIQEYVETYIAIRSLQRSGDSILFYRTVYGQQSLLSNHDFGWDFYWVYDQLTLTGGLLSYESYIEEQTQTQAYLGLDYQLSEQYSVGALLNYSDEDGEMYGEFSIGIDW